MNNDEYLEEEKDCADMLGITLEEYRESLKHVKVNTFDDENFDISKLIQESLEEEKDCADMLGMTLEEYREFCKNHKKRNFFDE